TVPHSSDCARPATERLKVSGEVFVAQADIPVAIKAAANRVTSLLDFMLVPPWWVCVGTRSVSTWLSPACRSPARWSGPLRAPNARSVVPPPSTRCEENCFPAWHGLPHRSGPFACHRANELDRFLTRPGPRPGPVAGLSVPEATAGASGRTAAAVAGSAGRTHNRRNSA